MKSHRTHCRRILGISPCKKGFGFFVTENSRGLVDWGVKYVRGDKNADCLRLLDALLEIYEPDVIFVEEVRDMRRGERVHAFVRGIFQLAREKRIPIRSVSQRWLRDTWEVNANWAVAQRVTAQFPELATRLPRPRKAWEGQNMNFALFTAAAMLLTATDVE